MKIVMAAAECAPFAKAGGLGDVIGALPKELAGMGHDVTVMLPNYNVIPERYASGFAFLEAIVLPFNGKESACRLFTYEMDGVRYVLVDHAEFFSGSEIYTPGDTGERYLFFCRAVLEFLNRQEEGPDVIHVHDWHTGIIPFLLKEDARYARLNDTVKTIMTIHNLQFQGVYPETVFTSVLGMDERYVKDGSVMWYDNVNLLKTGILYADLVTTVSGSYRDEILTERFGEGLDPLLKEKGAELIGIVNGIDANVYNPAQDSALAKEYDVTSVNEKAVNKRAVQQRFGLPERDDVPLLTMVSRLSGQKGIDILQEVLPEILKSETIQFVLIGSGEKQYETYFRELSDDFPDQAAAYIGFDESLAHLVYAGADLFLMPSHFEPCGLSQLISMRYGTVPVANRTGGLKDTIAEYDEATRSGTGFLSDSSDAASFKEAVKKALALYQHPDQWEAVRRNGMQGDYSWTRSAEQYTKVYKTLTGK